MEDKKSQLIVFITLSLIVTSVFVEADETATKPANDSDWVEYKKGPYTNELPDLDCPDYIYKEYNESIGISKNEFLNLYEYCDQIKKRKEAEQHTVEQDIQKYLDRCRKERSHDPSPTWDCLPENEEETIRQMREEFNKTRIVRIRHPPSLRNQTQEESREEFKNYTKENAKNDSWVNRLSNDTFYEDKEIPDNRLKTALITLNSFLKKTLDWLFK